MTTVWISVLTLIGGAVASGALTYVGTRRKLALDYDADLRKRRIEAYQDLWKGLEPLSRYEPIPFSHTEAKDLAEGLRSWYFRDGGLFLSTTARNDCFALQDILRYVVNGWGWETPDKLNLTPEAQEALRAYGSRLRTSLTLDVGTRTRPKMKGYIEPVNRQYEGTYQRASDHKEIRLKFSPRLLGGTRRLSVNPVIRSDEGFISKRKWMPSRMAIQVILKDHEDNKMRRVLLMEGGQIVEGPSSHEEGAFPPVIWHRSPI